MATHEVLPLESIIGYGFRPTDEEIMNDYLRPKINGKIKADCAIIPELNICEYDAWDLPEKSIIDSLKSRHPEWFFFAQNVPKHPNSERWNRSTRTGYWKATGEDRSIMTQSSSPMQIGKKKTLVFHRGQAPKGENTGWIIHEYSTGEPELDQAGLVLCRLFKKPKKGILISNGEKIECNIITPNKPQSTQDTTVQGDDASYEIIPQLQEIVPPNLPETVDESMTKSEETLSYSDIFADIDDSAINMDNLFVSKSTDDPDPSNLSCLNLGCGQNDSDLFHYNSSLDMSYPHLDDNGVGASLKHKDDQSDELLADLLASVEECPPEFNKILGNTTESGPSTQVCPTKLETLWDNISGSGSKIGDNSTRIGVSQDQFKNEPNPSGADNSTRIGVEFRRPPKKRTSANLNQLGSQGLTADGKAPRIRRLQSSLRIGSTVITNRHSTRSNKDHDEKAEISESGNNAEVEMPKMAYLGPSDNDVLSSSNNSQTKEPNELCLDPESALKKAASINFGRVTVVLSIILGVLCIGICWFFIYR